MTALIPHPLLSFALLAIWLLLNTSLAPAQLLLGATLAIAVPLACRRLLPHLLKLRRPALVVPFVLLVLWDIVVANVRVAILVLGPEQRLKPGFITVPLDMRDPGIATVLGGIITLTPGTVSLGVDKAVTRIDVHVLDLDDEQALIAQIKRRYEQPLKEMFAC